MNQNEALQPQDKYILKLVDTCISQVSKKGFNRALVDLASAGFGADQCMVFSYDNHRSKCVLSYNTRPRVNAQRLAEEYLSHGARQDPLRERLAGFSSSNEILVVPLSDIKEYMTAEYWNSFYEDPGLVDKISVLVKQNGLTLSLNFYRQKASGKFHEGFHNAWYELFKIAARISALHYSSPEQETLKSPLLSLSEREQEVCRYILNGHSVDSIAFEMGISANTVSTYRKRAYEKLDINSRSALFQLCS